ncbi:FAD binding domain-containing protein [Methylobacterium isbiliense]|jgi:2-furoyl-CoA dehydrogenase FAD binding subunit|uniref:6-hydroxypseudooxynicotine dehydrogenase complex subunit alpha n=1 Tax=Methylobacterium isbiliense TaxID=315478 RepID=A0ABQ4SR43_9HYPH|nr:FAD binding domain-containing protein [Methylobacterium isbiliense]MDN3626083.1 FAD binding domain-containing protein [Methylobacterium isbiliense]GJE04278.1 6-hydroxypseudooxynicotine dehydrogenase complex subunit alpha [Methylobacterium isbiliense]
MKPARFDYLRAASLDEALAAIARHGDEARIVAGGQSLVPMLNMRLTKPGLLVDVMRIETLRTPRRENGALVVPAGTRQAILLDRPHVADELPLLAAALPFVGHVQTRARGTLCGSVAHADPSAEIPLCLVALEGEVHLRSAKRARRVRADDFFVGMMVTDRAHDELVEAIGLPLRAPGTGYAFAEVGRRHGDFAIVACAAVVDGRRMRLAVGGVADRPTARDWPLLDGTALDDALNALAWDLGAGEDIHATARYRRDLVRRLGRRVLEQAAEEARRCQG